MLTLGSEATIVRDVVVDNCKIIGHVRVATLKLRPDTPQHYEDITFRNVTSESTAGPILSVQPWSQYANLQGAAPPNSVVRSVSLIGVKAHCGVRHYQAKSWSDRDQQYSPEGLRRSS